MLTGVQVTCSLIFIADDLDNLWAYDAKSNAMVWTTNIASAAGGNPVNCADLEPLGVEFAPCETPNYAGNTIGVIGTPVIDTTSKILYVVAPVYFPNNKQNPIVYDLFAVNILNPNGQNGISWVTIAGSLPGDNATDSDKCGSTYSGSNKDSLAFDADHIQRSALLLLGSGTTATVYAAFAPAGSEWENGWLFGYHFDSQHYAFSQTGLFATTPYGTGGGLWGSEAGPASDGTHIFVATGNGTFDFNNGNAGPDYGDSILNLGATANSNGVFPINDYFTPWNVFSYREPEPPLGLCPNDVDVGSGGILIIPDQMHNMTVMVSGDKQSNLYFENLTGLGGFNSGGSSNNNVETILTPNNQNNHPQGVTYPQKDQGYWSSGAYWKYVDSQQASHYFLYYAVSTDGGNPDDYADQPFPMYQYSLATTGQPITTELNQSAIPTSTLFCIHSPTPSVSSYQNTGGIVWAIESQNKNNPSPGNCEGTMESIALHAYDATNIASQLYFSPNKFRNFQVGEQTAFPVPTIFNGLVYVGTSSEVDVFGLCSEGIGGICPAQ